MATKNNQSEDKPSAHKENKEKLELIFTIKGKIPENSSLNLYYKVNS
jgi:hypothetical protein